MDMTAVEEVRMKQRAKGPATILAIGTANPSNCVYQNTYADNYFRVTNSEHETELKEKFNRIYERSMIKKRQDILGREVPKLGKEAAQKAITEWGQPISNITHLIFSTTIPLDMPGTHLLTKLLGLSPSVKRFKIYQHGCFSGGTVLRLAKDLAENNAGARVLVISSEITSIGGFRGPSRTELGNMVGQVLFGDGAAAMIVGSDPVIGVEQPIFQMVRAVQTRLPDCEDAIQGQLREAGLLFHIGKEVPELISGNIERSLREAFDPFNISDWNSIFWVGHPGGSAILNRVEAKLGLMPQKLRTARHVLSEYGNMTGASVLFVMDEMRRVSVKEGLRSTGEGLEWGVLFGFGPGITIETIVLRSVPIN
ncbi:hypothetical protein ACS0TY_023042 [Phlomoides rotata]